MPRGSTEGRRRVTRKKRAKDKNRDAIANQQKRDIVRLESMLEHMLGGSIESLDMKRQSEQFKLEEETIRARKRKRDKGKI